MKILKFKILLCFVFINLLFYASTTSAKDFTLVCSGADSVLKGRWVGEYLISAFPKKTYNEIFDIEVVSETTQAGRLSIFPKLENTVKALYSEINFKYYNLYENQGIIKISTKYSYNDDKGTANTDYTYSISLRSGLLNIKGTLDNFYYTVEAKCTGHQALFNFLNSKPVEKKTNNVKKTNSKSYNFKQFWWVVVLIGVGAFFVYMHTTKNLPIRKDTKKTSKSSGAIKSFFNGDVDLTTSFWGVYFGIGLVLGLLSFAIEKNDTLAGLYVLFILFPFTIYAMIGTWRSASKYKIEKQKKKEGTGWGTAAQVYIILSIIRVVVEIGKEFR